ncbi:uncharacterized protein [Gossypium hirsutum]|uniref:Uncharacterized protein n=1 Tax=Gossypium hirsutum TaxID=3635 RepID=A0ABM3BF83_GOSHI|nr:uncharacterized protein LOC121225466 [Gossypium hirsutum]
MSKRRRSKEEGADAQKCSLPPLFFLGAGQGSGREPPYRPPVAGAGAAVHGGGETKSFPFSPNRLSSASGVMGRWQKAGERRSWWRWQRVGDGGIVIGSAGMG